ncbi:hypothetical protein FAZ95_17690 [Trinickia violacea]|uniref:Transmembrane protein n=1 Tax=Trinickia violacea TaxID=2571746 RepID=A0A4P8IRL3_9BURK|nr:VC0807 family protein [Trinickia violacea]QCP50821.1 hypothetical protein FAZ95_17690 [Trinickia violacea]
MKHPFRYLSALCINVLLPWLVYRLVLRDSDYVHAVAASALPLIAWIAWDYFRLRHFDALSATVLACVALSFVLTLLGSAPQNRAIEAPMISGAVGVVLLLTFWLPRPLMFYLARSTLAREDHDSALRFEERWRAHPEMAVPIKRMTVVWGVGLVLENLLRCWIVWTWTDKSRAALISVTVSYAAYGVLTLWTVLYRRRIRKHPLAQAQELGETPGS